MDKTLPKSLAVTGWLFSILSALLALRLVWEQTLLTWDRGPQMVGFSLGHSPLFFFPLMIGLFGGALWLLVYLLFAWVRKSFGGIGIIFPAAIYVISAALISVPYDYWQRAFINKLMDSSHVAGFVMSAASQGDLESVKTFLSNGVDPNIRNRDGNTILHMASYSGDIELVKYVVENGADVNAISRWGDSPLEAAASEEHTIVAEYLVARGGIRVKGTEEQRDKAASEIVKETMEELERKVH